MSARRERTWRAGMRVKSAARLVRGRVLGTRPGVTVGSRVRIGKGVRFLLEPGARLALGDGVEIDDGTTIAAYRDATLELGAGCFVGHHCTLAAKDHIVIGPGTYLAEMVSIRDHDHDPDQPPSSAAALTAAVRIGRDVWLAAKVTVARGVDIGDATVVGANAVVTHALPSGVVAGGVPARVLRQRRPTEEPQR